MARSLSVRIANKWQKKRHPVEHDIVSEAAFVSDTGERGHMVTCSCGETIRVSVEPQDRAAAARNLAYDQWSVHKRDIGSI
jgi:hypothetical protein